MIPTSIDGTDITGATIDGTDVQEITVDGDVVFSAAPSNFPVAYSDLIAWYPFDSATYGGSNADDVTAILGGSGDDTAYDGTEDGAIYDSTGGVTDIRAGANSGAYEFRQNFNSSPNDAIDLPLFNLNVGTVTVWVNPDVLDLGNLFLLGTNSENFIGFENNNQGFFYRERLNNDTSTISTGETLATNQWTHLAWSTDGSNIKSWFDGTAYGPVSASENIVFDEIGYPYDGLARFSLDGHADDLRVYNKQLSDSEISNIISNTPHP